MCVCVFLWVFIILTEKAWFFNFDAVKVGVFSFFLQVSDICCQSLSVFMPVFILVCILWNFLLAQCWSIPSPPREGNLLIQKSEGFFEDFFFRFKIIQNLLSVFVLTSRSIGDIIYQNCDHVWFEKKNFPRGVPWGATLNYSPLGGLPPSLPDFFQRFEVFSSFFP